MWAKIAIVAFGVPLVGCLILMEAYPTPHTDVAEMRTTQERLAVLVAEFDALPTPRGAEAEAAERDTSCRVDVLGEVDQPIARRSWDVGANDRVAVARALGASLSDAGWRRESRDGRRSSWFVSRRDGWSATAAIRVLDDPSTVSVIGSIEGASPCSPG